TLPPEALEFLFKPIPRSRDEYIEYFVSTWVLLSGPYYPMDEKTSRRLAEESFRRGFSPAGSARQIAAILAARNRKEDLKRLKVPALVIHGDEDPLVPVECGLDTAQAIPGAKLKIIKGMGHALPKALWKEIIGAITDHARE
ncbi:MAG: alpha/beta fold hydrolase, partial [Desulfomonilia bacterium]